MKDKKSDTKEIAKVGAIGAGSGVALGVAKETIEDFNKFKKIKELPNYKGNHFKKFVDTLKPGDILLESTKGNFKEESKVIKRLLSREGPKATVYLNKIQNEYVIPGATGGVKYTHGLVYLGKGKFAEADQSATAVNRIFHYKDIEKNYFKNHDYLSLRFTKGEKTQLKIANATKNLVKTNYRNQGRLVLDVVKRNLGLSLKGMKGQGITCTELVANALKKGGKKVSGISTYHIEPRDVLFSKNAKLVSTYGNPGFTGKQASISAIGKLLRPNLKFAIAGAGISLASALLWKMKKNQNKNKLFKNIKGKWITTKQGKHIFIK